jgi:ammonia channel protein AmtB
MGVALVVFATVCYGLAVTLAAPMQQKYGSVNLMAKVLALATIWTAPYGLWQIGDAGWEVGPVLAVVVLGVVGGEGHLYPESVFAMFQGMFAIITVGLITGAIAERMRFSALMVFCMAWMVIVYFPVTHMMWGVGGWMNGLWNAKAAIRAIDFAGGIAERTFRRRKNGSGDSSAKDYCEDHQHDDEHRMLWRAIYVRQST